MQAWNVVVTVREQAFSRAMKLLQPFGQVHRTEFFNVLVLEVPDTEQFVQQLRQLAATDASISDILARVVPATRTLTFQSPEEFENKARQIVSEWLPALAAKSFHVRMHRRGFKGRLSSQHEEGFLDHYLLTSLEEQHVPGRISFEDPDFIVSVETVGQRAGLSCWSREDRARYPFLGLD
jgi:tRNA(Ser,Leu) C12 N-acetylase TAN1